MIPKPHHLAMGHVLDHWFHHLHTYHHYSAEDCRRIPTYRFNPYSHDLSNDVDNRVENSNKFGGLSSVRSPQGYRHGVSIPYR
ncbi:hypothetical protein SAMN00768000_2456 [Sulfobacillus thermosulfidooxidans DSM 9293]|uniref:Uncharacterized protein n=2 Tax=Sulfobacillus thermosulfidooxidans TaxID=28034 RepID=A0A1W1WHR3_SULTA|nr:MAG: hypothetical protein C7B47_13420 [Sulfobacillus thermosulfidooxidans]SMC05795.1 hypothetical protein SAMN00768000_2456 [Sulfobacillus thermosulfidooxidans DSM 9293]